MANPVCIMTVASPVWDIVGSNGAGDDNGLSSVGLRPSDGGVFMVLGDGDVKYFWWCAALIQTSRVVCVVRCRCSNPTRQLLVAFLVSFCFV